MQGSWRTIYEGDLQTAVLPAASNLLFLGFLVWQRQRGRWGAPGSRDRFVARYCAGFAVVTLIDLVASFPGVEWADLGFDATSYLAAASTVIADFRVFWLVLVLLQPAPPGGKGVGLALLLAILPLAIGTAGNLLIASIEPRLYGHFMWLIHEASMLAVVLVLLGWVVRRHVPAQRGVRVTRWVLGYVALYYALFAIADAAILLLRLDLGWLVRCVPHQLYFSLYLPFVWVVWQRSAGPGAPR
jgi:hypothetical protein